MVTKLSIAIAMCIGSGMAQPDIQTLWPQADAGCTKQVFIVEQGSKVPC
jgi:hypothetical protein